MVLGANGKFIGSIPRVRNIRPEKFRTDFWELGLPVVITEAIDWPALGKWSHKWFKDTHGDVVVDLSVNPTHTRKVVQMALRQYISRIEQGVLGGGLYLDQFPLDRIPALSQDFKAPDYCIGAASPIPHLWLGPGTTVLSFHKDNHNSLVQIDNIFVQLIGRKRIILASPDNDAFMYPRPVDEGAYWHSQVDPENPDLEHFPNFANAELVGAVVGPGDIIFIPRNYWHYVRALEKSISMSFWWVPFAIMRFVEDIMIRGSYNSDFYSDEYSFSLRDLIPLGGGMGLANGIERLMNEPVQDQIRMGLLDRSDFETREVLRCCFDGR